MMPIIYLAFIAVAGILLLGAISANGSKGAKNSKRAASNLNKALIAERWRGIQMSAGSGASGLKNSLNDADKLFDYTMKQLGYPGETMAERLKVAQTKLSDRESVWRAHKLRNSLAHDMDFDLVPSQVRGALAAFERGLKDLGAL